MSADLFSDDFDDEELLDDDDLVEESAAESPAPASNAEPEESYKYADVYAFVEIQLAPSIQRKISLSAGRQLAWDPRWWSYQEVKMRLSALHRAWEAAYASEDPSAMSTWWLHHCDPMMDRILDGSSGPFHAYNPEHPLAPVPLGLEVIPHI